jgi:hypothetical protein
LGRWERSEILRAELHVLLKLYFESTPIIGTQRRPLELAGAPLMSSSSKYGGSWQYYCTRQRCFGVDRQRSPGLCMRRILRVFSFWGVHVSFPFAGPAEFISGRFAWKYARLWLIIVKTCERTYCGWPPHWWHVWVLRLLQIVHLTMPTCAARTFPLLSGAVDVIFIDCRNVG